MKLHVNFSSSKTYSDGFAGLYPIAIQLVSCSAHCNITHEMDHTTGKFYALSDEL